MRKDNLCQNNVSDLPVNDLNVITRKMFQQHFMLNVNTR